jgi:hypothetical protein
VTNFNQSQSNEPLCDFETTSQASLDLIHPKQAQAARTLMYTEHASQLTAIRGCANHCKSHFIQTAMKA